jgi:hypothetical protein
VGNSLNRRRHERFVLRPMYTPVAVRLLDRDNFELEGHAYDISEGGLFFELDEPIAPGTPVALRIALPAGSEADGAADENGTCALARIVRLVQDDDEPGPIPMAAVFTAWSRPGDRDRLLRRLASGRYARAA